MKRLAEIVLDLPRLPERMECFDISHTQGAETVACMVVFEGGKPTRRRDIVGSSENHPRQADDFKSMAENHGTALWQ